MNSGGRLDYVCGSGGGGAEADAHDTVEGRVPHCRELEVSQPVCVERRATLLPSEETLQCKNKTLQR